MNGAEDERRRSSPWLVAPDVAEQRERSESPPVRDGTTSAWLPADHEASTEVRDPSAWLIPDASRGPDPHLPSDSNRGRWAPESATVVATDGETAGRNRSRGTALPRRRGLLLAIGLVALVTGGAVAAVIMGGDSTGSPTPSSVAAGDAFAGPAQVGFSEQTIAQQERRATRENASARTAAAREARRSRARRNAAARRRASRAATAPVIADQGTAVRAPGIPTPVRPSPNPAARPQPRPQPRPQTPTAPSAPAVPVSPDVPQGAPPSSKPGRVPGA